MTNKSHVELNKPTFIAGMEYAHTLLRNVHKNDMTPESYKSVSDIYGAFIMMIGNFDNEIVDSINYFLITNNEFDKAKCADLYDMVFDIPETDILN